MGRTSLHIDDELVASIPMEVSEPSCIPVGGKEVVAMAKPSKGVLSKAGKTLASSCSKGSKSKAGRTLGKGRSPPCEVGRLRILLRRPSRSEMAEHVISYREYTPDRGVTHFLAWGWWRRRGAAQ